MHGAIVEGRELGTEALPTGIVGKGRELGTEASNTCTPFWRSTEFSRLNDYTGYQFH